MMFRFCHGKKSLPAKKEKKKERRTTSTSSVFSPTNQTGYARIACAAYAFSVALTNPVQFMAFYFFRYD